VLRPWAFSDVDALIAAVSESQRELRAFMPWAHQLPTREEEYGLLARFQASFWSGTEFFFGIFSPAGEVLGGIGLHARMVVNPRALEVGFWCHSRHAGRGVATLATRALAALAFERFGCDRLQVLHDEANAASRRVVEKCGFLFEGVLRNVGAAVPRDLYEAGYRGTGRDRIYAILPEDWARMEWRTSLEVTAHDALGGVQSI
jgi:RimJ/RimL family protein N-acetyltransferase